jgi:prepilin-type processing-associated H-X9-DG protein
MGRHRRRGNMGFVDGHAALEDQRAGSAFFPARTGRTRRDGRHGWAATALRPALDVGSGMNASDARVRTDEAWPVIRSRETGRGFAFRASPRDCCAAVHPQVDGRRSASSAAALGGVGCGATARTPSVVALLRTWPSAARPFADNLWMHWLHPEHDPDSFASPFSGKILGPPFQLGLVLLLVARSRLLLALVRSDANDLNPSRPWGRSPAKRFPSHRRHQ